MALYPARSITKQTRMAASQVFLVPYDGNEVLTDTLINMGNVKTLTLTQEIQEWEDWSVQHGVRELIGTYPIQKGGTLEMSSTTWNELMYRMMYVSDFGYVQQDAVATKELLFEDVSEGQIRQLPLRNATIISADDGAAEDPVEWVEGTHFTLHAPSGIVEFLKKPEGASDLKLVLEAPAIANVDHLPKFKFMSSQGVLCKVIAVGTNKVGVQGEMTVGKVRFLPSGGVSAVSEGQEGDVAALTGRVYADENGDYGGWQAYSKI